MLKWVSSAEFQAPPTRSSQSTGTQKIEDKGSIDRINIAPLNYDNAILVIKLMIPASTIQQLF